MTVPPPGPKDHIVRKVTTQGGSPVSISEPRKTTIGNTMAKVKDFMARNGNPAIKEFGEKITGNYELDIFPQAGNGFLIEVGGKSLHVTSTNLETDQLTKDIQLIWDSIHPASLHGSTSPAPTGLDHPPALSSARHDVFASPPSSVHGGGRSRSLSSASSLELGEEDEITDEARAKADAMNYYRTDYGRLDFSTQLGRNILHMWQTGKNVLDGFPAASHFTEQDHTFLKSPNERAYNDQMLDLFLLDDIAKLVENEKFSEAAVSFNLLSSSTRYKLNAQLDPQIPVLLPTTSAYDTEGVKKIAGALRSQKKGSIARKLESLQGSIRFEASQKLASIRLQQTQQAHAAYVADLQGQIQRLQAQISLLSANLATYQVGSFSLYYQLTTKTQELQRSQAALAALTEEKARALEAAAQRYTHLAKSQAGRISKLQREKEDALARVLELERANTNLSAQLLEARRALAASRVSIAEKQAALTQASAQKAALSERIEALNATVNARLSTLGTAEALAAAATASNNLPTKIGILIDALDRQNALTSDERTAKEAALRDAAVLQGQLEALGVENTRLSAQLGQVNRALAAALEANGALQARETELIRANAALTKDLDAARASLETSTSRVAALTDTLAARERTIEELREGLGAAQDETARAEATTRDLTARNQALTRQLEEARATLADNQITITGLKRSQDEMAAQKAALSERIEALNATVNARLSTLGTAEASAAAATASDNLPAKIGILINALDRQIARTSDERTAKEAALREAAVLQGQLEALGVENTRLSAQLGQVNRALATALEANGALQARETELIRANAALTKDLDAARAALETSSARVAALTDTLAARERTIEELREGLRAAQDETRGAKADSARIQSRLDAALGTLEEERGAHTSALQAATARFTAADEELRSLRASHVTQSRALEALRAEFATVSDQKAAAIALFDRTNATLTQRVKEAQGLRAGLAAREEKIGTIEPLLREAEAQKKRDDAEIEKLRVSISHLMLEKWRAEAGLKEGLRIAAQAQVSLEAASRAFSETLAKASAQAKGVNDDLASQLEGARARITALTHELEAERGDKSRIEALLNAELEKTARLTPELKDATTALAQSQINLAAAERRNAELSERNEALAAANSKLISDHAEQIRGINARHLTAIADLEAAQRLAISELTSSKDAEIRAQASRLLELDEQIRRQSAEITAQIGKLKAIALSLGIEGADALNDMASLERVITPALADLKARKEALELEVPRLTEARANAEGRLADATRSFSETEAALRLEIASLRESDAAKATRMDEQLAEITRLQAELSKRTGSLYKAIISGASLASQLQKAKAAAAVKDATLLDNEATMTALRARIHDLELLTGEQDATNRGVLRDKAQLDARLSELTLIATATHRDLGESREEILRLQGALSEKDRLISELSASFKKANAQLKSDIGAQKSALIELQVDMASRMREAQGALSTLAGAFREKNDALVASLDAAARENAARADEIATLRPLADELTRLQEALAPRSLTTPEGITAHLARHEELEAKQAAFERELSKIGPTPESVKAKIDSQAEIIAGLRSELGEARAVISSRDARITALGLELAASQRALEEAQASHRVALTSLSASKDAAVSALDEARRDFESALRAKDEASALAIAKVREALTSKTEEADRLTRENESLRLELEALRGQLIESSAQNAALKKEVKEAKAATFEAKIAAFVEKRALKEKAKALSLWRLQTLESKHEKEKARLEAQVAEHLETIGTLSKDKTALLTFLKSQLKADEVLDPKKNELDSLIEAFTNRLKAQERQVATSLEELTHANATLGAQRVTLASQEEALASLRSELAARDLKISGLEQAAGVAAGVAAGLHTALDEARRTKGGDDSTIADLRRQLTEALGTVSRYNLDLEALRAQVGILEPDLSSAEEALASTRRQLEALTASHGALNRDHEAQTLELAKTKASCEALEKANTDLIAAHKLEITNLSFENAAAIAQIQARLDEALLLIGARDEQIRGLQEELAALQRAKESEISGLKRDHEEALGRLGTSSSQAREQLVAQHTLALKAAEAKHAGILAEKERDIEAAAIALVSLQEKHQALVKLQGATMGLLEKANLEIGALTSERDGLKGEKAELNLALAELTRQLQDQGLKLAAQAASASTEIRALTEAKGRLEADLTRLLESFEVPAEDVASAIGKIQAQEAKIRALSSQIDEKTGALSRLSDASSREASALREEIAGLQKALAAEKAATAAVNIRNQEALSSLLTKLASMQDVIPEARAILQGVQDKLSSRTGSALNMAELLHDLMPLGDTISEKLADIQSAYTLEMGLKTAKLDQLTAALALLKSEHTEVERQLGISNEGIRILQAKLVAQEEDSAAQLAEALETFRTALLDLGRDKGAEIQKHLETIAGLTAANRDASSEIEKLRALNGVLASQVEEANRQKDQAQAKATADVDDVRRELSEQRAINEGLQSTNNGQLADIRKKQGQIQGLSQEVVQAKAHAAELAGELSKLQPAHLELQRQFARNEEELAALKKEHAALLEKSAGDTEALRRSLVQIEELEEAQRAAALLLEGQAAQIRDLTAERSTQAAALLELRGQFDELLGKAAATALELDRAREENRGLVARLGELEPAVLELRRLRAACEDLAARNRELEEEKAEAEAGGKAALEAKRAAQEQLRASLELARQLFEEALPKSAYGRFDSLFHNHLGALGRCLEDPRDLDRRISAALRAALLAETRSTSSSGVSAPAHLTLARSCAESIVITSMPFADDRRVLEAGGGMDHFVAFKPAKLLPEFPMALEIKDPTTRAHVEALIEALRPSSGKGAGATARSGGSKASASPSSAMAEFIGVCKDGITSAFSRHTPSMGKARSSLAHNVGSMGGGARSLSALGGGGVEATDLAAVSAMAASDVGKLLSPESVAGSRAIEHLFNIFMDNDEIKSLLFCGHDSGAKAELQSRMKAAALACDASKEEELARARAALASARESADPKKAEAEVRAAYQAAIREIDVGYQAQKDAIIKEFSASLAAAKIARKETLQAEIDALQAPIATKEAEIAAAEAAFERASRVSGGASTASRGSGDEDMAMSVLEAARSAHKILVHELLNKEEEMRAIESYDALLAAHVSEEVIFTALNQRFSKNAPYFEERSPQQIAIDHIVNFVTHRHIDRLLHLIMRNKSLAQDLCVRRIVVGAQMLGHSQQEKLELNGALKSSFTLLNLLSSAILNRIMTGR